jgi:hypothetical protein
VPGSPLSSPRMRRRTGPSDRSICVARLSRRQGHRSEGKQQ